MSWRESQRPWEGWAGEVCTRVWLQGSVARPVVAQATVCIRVTGEVVVNTTGHQGWELGFILHPNSRSLARAPGVSRWGLWSCVWSLWEALRGHSVMSLMHERVEDGGISSVGVLLQDSSSTMQLDVLELVTHRGWKMRVSDECVVTDTYAWLSRLR